MFVVFQAKFCRNMSKARELWSGILQAGFSSQAQMCLEYVRLERYHTVVLLLNNTVSFNEFVLVPLKADQH